MALYLVKEKVLGKGSYGTVYRGVLSDVPQIGYGGVTVAVKSTSIPPCALSLRKEENILNNFSRCPEIVQCYGSEITVEDGVCVANLILEYAPYGTLSDLIKKGAFSENQVRVFTGMLLRGLSCIHRMGFVHCDLKPENVLVFPGAEMTSYQLKIADFGLAMTSEEKKNFDPRNWRFRYRGTPLYMSPESVTMGEIEPELDIWSLGCVVLEMVTGLPLWKSWRIEREDDFLCRLVFLRAKPRIPETVSMECRDFLSKCFDRESDRRWSADMLLKHPFLAPNHPRRSSFNLNTSRSLFSYGT
ncbi:hypothetical protein L6164_036185 [Bauhinia variegata]|uniref:Uncharacterized protein n=1 Tax=Bauhinia variegata TaxID=167791 RepID=A0ACB9KGC5_BAUVA|nr:hypothetical protein L6164_036185 [Bauhinia variegata]